MYVVVASHSLCLKWILLYGFLKVTDESQVNEEQNINKVHESASNSSVTNVLEANALSPGEVQKLIEQNVSGSAQNNVIEANSENELEAIKEVSQEDYRHMVHRQESDWRSCFVKGVLVCIISCLNYAPNVFK